ncbi:hypothetical protein ACPA9J_27155 [Pseudomonas aeruginosa]
MPVVEQLSRWPARPPIRPAGGDVRSAELLPPIIGGNGPAPSPRCRYRRLPPRQPGIDIRAPAAPVADRPAGAAYMTASAQTPGERRTRACVTAVQGCGDGVRSHPRVRSAGSSIIRPRPLPLGVLPAQTGRRPAVTLAVLGRPPFQDVASPPACLNQPPASRGRSHGMVQNGRSPAQLRRARLRGAVVTAGSPISTPVPGNSTVCRRFAAGKLVRPPSSPRRHLAIRSLLGALPG